MITLVNYADSNMTESQQICSESAKANGVDRVWPQSPDTIPLEFKELNREIWDAPRHSYWLWKPYIIYRAMIQPATQEGDIIIYSDSGVKWISNVNEIISRMDQDIFLFSNGHQHVHWCKMSVIESILTDKFNIAYGWLTTEEERKKFDSFQQVQASIIFFKVNQITKNFVKEWLLYCQMPGFIDDSPSKLPNHPEFAEHRHDQAILTCLQIKYGYRLHWWPDKLWYESQKYRWPEDTYPSMIEHHRKRNKGCGGGKDPEWQ